MIKTNILVDTILEIIRKEGELVSENKIETIPYSALIDIAAVFKDIDNLDVVKMIKKNEKYKNKSFIYLDFNDNKMILDKNESIPRKYTGQIFLSQNDVFYYYSQKNIVGIDFKQPTNMRGLATIHYTNKYTEVAQGVYRLRKLNKGHVIDIAYINNKDTMTENNIYIL